MLQVKIVHYPALPSVIRKKLEDQGVDTSGESDEEIIYHIFDSEFSTQDNVSEISGRGIGMSAIKHAIDELDGQIILESRIDQGVAMIIIVPCEN